MENVILLARGAEFEFYFGWQPYYCGVPGAHGYIRFGWRCIVVDISYPTWAGLGWLAGLGWAGLVRVKNLKY